MILTPEQIDDVMRPGFVAPGVGWGDVADTLAAYAPIVEKVAEGDPLKAREWNSCPYCNGQYDLEDNAMPFVHNHDCAHILARKLRGKT